MTLRAIEGWDGYANGLSGGTFEDVFEDKWTPTGGMDQSRIQTDSDRYSNEKIWDLTSGADGWYVDLSDNPEELVCGMYVKTIPATNRSTWYRLFEIVNNSSIHIRVEINSRDVRIRLNNATVTDATIANVLEPNQWNLIELKAKVHDTTGYWYLYVNGVLVDSNTSVDTKYSTLNVNRLNVWNYHLSQINGDFYCCDLAGSQNNDVLGPFHVQGILPNAVGANADWTPSSAVDNYTLVNEETADEADYVDSGVADEIDLYNYENLSGTWDTIFGLQTNSRIFLDGAGSETVAVLCKSGTTTNSANFTITNTTMGVNDEGKNLRILEDDPDTSSPWSSANIDAAQFGVKFI